MCDDASNWSTDYHTRDNDIFNSNIHFKYFQKSFYDLFRRWSKLKALSIFYQRYVVKKSAKCIRSKSNILFIDFKWFISDINNNDS